MFKLFLNQVRGINPLNRAEKQRAMRAGLIVNAMIDSANRFGEETPCSRCDYRAVCKFDWQINEYRSIESVNKTEFLNGLTGGCHG